jgi:hypothetical protein
VAIRYQCVFASGWIEMGEQHYSVERTSEGWKAKYLFSRAS